MKNNNLTSPQRQRSSVAIQGIDKSTPDDLVQDGKCEVLHNMRYKDGAWRPVHPYTSQITASSNIVYHHPVAGYITEVFANSIYTYSLFGESSSTEIATFKKKQSIFHFGNILIFTSDEGVKNFIFKGNSYIPFTIPPQATVSVSYGQRDHIMPDLGYISKIKAWEKFNSQTTYTDFAWKLFNQTEGTPAIPTYDESEKDRWCGEIAYFVAYRLSDGTEYIASPIDIISSEDGFDTPDDYGNEPDEFSTSLNQDPTATGDNTLYVFYTQNNKYCKQLAYIAPTITVTLPDGIDRELITSIAIYSTRIYNMISYVPKFRDGALGSFFQLPEYSDNKLLNQPFYRIREFELLKDKDKYTFELFADIMETAVTMPVYTPNNNIHEFIPSARFDYNNRLHIADVKLFPFKGFEYFDKPIVSNTYTSYNLEIDGISHLFSAYSLNLGEDKINFGRKVLSYPDYRIKSLLVMRTILSIGAGNAYTSTLFEFTSAMANNFAYHLSKPTATLKYPNISGTLESSNGTSETVSHIPFPNRIQVSSANNCFSFPFENTYAVGSSQNRIIAMQSAAMKIADEQVGALPLYVFTEEGIFALRAGESTLYAAVNPINYDKVINPSTLAINGAVAYITEQGVHLLTNEGSTAISAPIHKADGMPDLEFLKSCVFLHSKQFDEFMIYKETDERAYVYNISQGYWSTRDVIGSKINTDELVDNTTIYDLNNEDESKSLSVEVTTRPIKLGNVEFKRLETIIPRMATNDHIAIVNMDVVGSVNGTEYMPLRSIENMEIDAKQLNPIILRRTPFSAKYFKYHMEMEPKMHETFNPSFTHIDFEWYTRFVRRMR
ncbi:MAG: hypothetical protein J6U48_04885 [Alistipes sp.]|nr:hypothetical protein [Alistipes sp.]